VWCVWTSRFSATGAGSLSPDLQPVAADPVRTLTLNGGDAARTSEETDGAPVRLSLRQGWKPEG
jgi:hypothetical protein